jgi:hypothetical protein
MKFRKMAACVALNIVACANAQVPIAHGQVTALSKNMIEPAVTADGNVHANGSEGNSSDWTKDENRACLPSREDRTSETCAAWKAADVGADAAYWAFIQMILSGLGFIGLLVSLYFTGRATTAAAQANADTAASLAVAMRDADATESLVRVSQENAERELRAYLDFEEAKFLSEPKSDTQTHGVIGLRTKIKNYGRTPATDVELETVLYHVDFIGGPRTLLGNDKSNLGMIAPGDFCGHNLWCKVDKALAGELRGSSKFIEVVVEAAYVDVFGHPHKLCCSFEGGNLDLFGAIDGSRSWK